MTPPQMQKRDYETLAEFRYTLRRFLAFSQKAAESVGLTPKSHQAMLSIKGYPGRDRVTIGELAEHLQIRHHSAVGLVDRMEAQKLIRRRPSTEDRRQVLLEVTPKGTELLERLSAAHRDELRKVGPHLKELLGRVEAMEAAALAG